MFQGVLRDGSSRLAEEGMTGRKKRSTGKVIENSSKKKNRFSAVP
jgi:hypothetical protein